MSEERRDRATSFAVRVAKARRGRRGAPVAQLPSRLDARGEGRTLTPLPARDFENAVPPGLRNTIGSNRTASQRIARPTADTGGRWLPVLALCTGTIPAQPERAVPARSDPSRRRVWESARAWLGYEL